MIDISKLDKADVLRVLFNDAKPQGMGLLHYVPEDMSVEDARAMLEKRNYFDYLQGRVMKVEIKGDTLDPRLYDRDNGPGAAKQAISKI